LGVLLVSTFTSAEPATGDQPNILYVMLDDAGYGDFGAFGSPHVQTPAFDRMCREGMRFTHHYSGSAVCAPTRCVLMTGLHTGHCRRRDNTVSAHAEDFLPNRPLVFLEPEDLTVAEVLRSAGYVTGGIGKWGLGNPGTNGSPDKQGFDHFYGYLDQVHAHDYYPQWLWKNGMREELAGNLDGKQQTYTHDLFEQDTLDFIRRNQDDRFFLYLPYTLPHGKYVIPETDPAVALYEQAPWPQQVKNYAAMITRADRSIGAMLNLLKELKLDEKTIIFYTSDNGPNRPFVKPLKSAGQFRGIKRQLYEGGIRAAMAVRWPGQIKANTRSEFVWSMIDFFPTACELAGTASPEHLDGRSVLPTLRGREQSPHDHIYWEIHHPFQQAVRSGQWKAIRFGTDQPLELYDVLADPGESKNVAAMHPEEAARIEGIMSTSHTPSRYFPAKP
jgi:arylsulfatase A-like enzyme